MSEEIKPISPNEIMDNLKTIIPSVVIQAVNNLLKLKYRGNDVSIKQKDIMEEILRLDESMTSNVIYDNRYMDFESIYRENGWNVVYDKPGYGENYDAYFKFSKKK